MEGFAERLYMLRTEKEWSQRELAKKVGVTVATVSLWETEKTSPSLFLAECLAEVFGVSLDYLAGRIEQRNYTKQ